MLVIDDEIDVNANVVNDLDVDLFKAVCEFRLVDKLLHRVQVKGESLVLCIDWAPKVQDFRKRVLLKASQ
jgi:hypothetical protein